jgi:hypothetical protein
MAKKGKSAPQEGDAQIKKSYYHTVLWKNIKTVFQCDTCGTNRDDEDAMILHVLLHYPKNEQEDLFNLLVKEKK